MSSSYVPLWCKTNYAFLEGASHPEEYIEEAARFGMPALAICDRDGVYGIPRGHFAAKELGLPFIVGSEITLQDGETLVLLCMNREGYASLCQLCSIGRLRSEKGESAVSVEEVAAHQRGLIAILPETCRGAAALVDAFGDRLYIGLSRHHRAEETEIELRQRAMATRYDRPLVAFNEVLYHSKSRRPLQDVLACIRNGVTLATAGSYTKPNAEYALKSPQVMAQLFSDMPLAIERTREIASRCTFKMDELRYRYPSEQLPSGMSSMQWLRELTFQGAAGRYPETGVPDDVRVQLERELKLIDQLDYPGYFLTMYEIVQFCRREKILCQGRGSAANSAVCYCLGITAIDPVRMGLLFERFISIERPEPPDIDLDIAHERREEAIQHMYTKYGRTHAAMVANVIRYRTRSALRDVGKVLGFSEVALDRMSKLFSYYDDLSNIPREIFDVDNPLHGQLVGLARELHDFPRHLSIHPGGFLLGHEPIATLVPVENATMEGRTVIQWDKRDVDALGLFKVDLLGLGALTQLDLCFQMLKARGEDLSMATIPAEDPATYAMLQKADTVGVFQIESRAQMSMLPRLKPKTFYDIVIEVSIVRPGPITGGMVHPFLRRREGSEPVDYPHESLRPVLEKTLGIPLFQEQVMKLAVIAADYTPGEADQLRRDMAAWRSSGKIEKHQERLISRMVKKGIAPEFAERVFQQIRGFGEYGFPESHAASFALICYATAWFRCHHLNIFTCGLLNAQPMGFYSPSTIIEDAKRHGLSVLPIDVRVSDWQCTLEGDAVRMGLRYVKGLSESEGRHILAARSAETLDAFIARAEINSGALESLAEADALSSYGVDRRQALWETTKHARPTLPVSTDRAVQFDKPTSFDDIRWDYDAMSHSTRGHVLGPLRGELMREGLPDARTVAALEDGARIRYAGLVICRQRPATASGVTFMTLEDETGFVNLVLWQKIFEQFHIIAKTCSFLGVSGRVQSENGVVHLVADRLWQPRITLPTPKVSSRDFH